MTWHLITATDERQRCCIVINGARCKHSTAFRVAARDTALDDYTYVCAEHLHLVMGPSYQVTRVEHAE